MNWHKRLTIARERKGLKKSAFAKLAGVSAPTVTDWENGDTKMIEGSNLVKVCEVLEITAEWLINGLEDVEIVMGAGVGTGKAPPWCAQEAFQLLEIYYACDVRGREEIMISAAAVRAERLQSKGVRNDG
jgi:transcriptional regulator with XRE-family HTH domain